MKPRRKDAHLTEPLLGGTLMAEEIALEEEAVELGVQRYIKARNEAVARGDAAMLKPVERLILAWIHPLIDAIKAEQKAIMQGKAAKGRAVYGPLIMLESADKVALIALTETLSACLLEPTGTKVSTLGYAIGRSLIAEANMRRIYESDRERRDKIEEDSASLSEEELEARKLEALSMSPRVLKQRFSRLTPRVVNRWADKFATNPHRTNQRTCMETGVWLIWNVLEAATLPSEDGEPLPGLLRRTSMRRGRKSVIIRLTKHAMEVIDDADRHRQSLWPRYLPMIVPPYPWCDEEGGYVSIRTPFTTSPRIAHKRALAAANLDLTKECLNAVNAQAWRINRRVLDTAKAVWNAGGNTLGLPPRERVYMPPETDSTDIEIVKANKRARAEAWRRNHQVDPPERELMLRRFWVADKFKDRGRIYFPHQLDFRGRIYPIPQPLNHQGPDLCRALLEWGDARDVTPIGRRWLEIHAANCYGHDKLPFDARVAWTQNHMRQIELAAADPLKDEFWRHADKGDGAWKFLAACFALTSADAGARLPVQVDGTCNGLQHYTAMGRDLNAAASVNLLPASSPADIYRDVAEAILPRVRADAEGGNVHARLVLPHIGRAVCKQPVMTKVYGVTAIGARGQVINSLSKLGIQHRPAAEASKYLAPIILEGVSAVCQAADAIMTWMRVCAGIVAKSGSLCGWTTPVGFPVAQAYYADGRLQINTLMGWIDLYDDDGKVVNVKHQVNGIAPNFVHGVDAAHLFLTGLEAHRQGIAFGSIHDGFLSHAETMPQLRAIIPQTFLDVHREPLLDQLRDQLQALCPDTELPAPPAPGTLDLSEVLCSQYFFS